LEHYFWMADYRKLRAWNKADALAKVVYKLAEATLDAGEAELADQMKRAALSIPANIAEGSGHRSRKEYARFVTYSIASSCELENHVKFAMDVRAICYADWKKTSEKIVEVRKMLRGFLRKLGG
jgi:four helix bundle protein